MSDRPCTCHPDDNPPVPCLQKFALSECKAAAPVAAPAPATDEIMALADEYGTSNFYDGWNKTGIHGKRTQEKRAALRAAVEQLVRENEALTSLVKLTDPLLALKSRAERAERLLEAERKRGEEMFRAHRDDLERAEQDAARLRRQLMAVTDSTGEQMWMLIPKGETPQTFAQIVNERDAALDAARENRERAERAEQEALAAKHDATVAKSACLALGERWERAEADLAAARELLKEAREWVDESTFHNPSEVDECHICKRVARIDALLAAR